VDEVLDAWRINHRVNLRLIDNISDEEQCGHPVDQAVRYCIWDWDRI
jgi:hypothetical protein